MDFSSFFNNEPYLKPPAIKPFYKSISYSFSFPAFFASMSPEMKFSYITVISLGVYIFSMIGLEKYYASNNQDEKAKKVELILKITLVSLSVIAAVYLFFIGNPISWMLFP